MQIDLGERAKRELASEGIPVNLHEGLIAYFEQRRPTGDFLRCVLENDFAGAVTRADSESLGAVRALACWLMTNVPSSAWGSPERVKAWLDVEKRPYTPPTLRKLEGAELERAKERMGDDEPPRR
jgi:hypothetical protein